MNYYSEKTVKTVLFDLDGTLLDTSEGCIESVIKASSQIGIGPLSVEIARKFIGPPIHQSFMKYCGCSLELAQHGADVFRDYYKTKALFKACLYSGMIETLQMLKEADIKIGVATYKREDYAISILEHFGIAPFCMSMHGADNNNLLSKADIINLCIEEMTDDRDSAVLIGDTEHDALGAKTANISFIGVTYGFGFKSKEDVNQYPNIGCANSTFDILNYVIKKK